MKWVFAFLGPRPSAAQILSFYRFCSCLQKMQYSTLSTEEFFVSCLYKVHFPPSHLSTPASR